jgi:double-stranded uracil-DNA glycosylase
VLFVGINPGTRSAAVGHHFAGYSNRFWKLLFDSDLVPIPLSHEDDGRLPEWGIGLTNLVARSTRGIDQLQPRDYAIGRRKLLAKVRRYRPEVVALLGITICQSLFPRKRAERSRTHIGRRHHRLGLRQETLSGVRVFVLPNPSGRNAHYSYRQMLEVFRSLRDSTR